MKHFLLATLAMLCLAFSAGGSHAQDANLSQILDENAAIIIKGSRKTIEPAITALRESGMPDAQRVLELWQAKSLWVIKADNRFVTATKTDDGYEIVDVLTGEELGTVEKKTLKQIKPNAGVRGMIGAALVQFQLMDPDAEKRLAALTAIDRAPEASHLPALRGAIAGEADADILAAKIRLERLLSVRFETDTDLRVAAIKSLKGDLGVDARAALNPILATKRLASAEQPSGNIATVLTPGDDNFTRAEAYELLVAAELAPAIPTPDDIRNALAANIDGAKVGGVPIAQLDTDAMRAKAYGALADANLVPPLVTEADITTALAAHQFHDIYLEDDAAVTGAAGVILDGIETKVGFSQAVDLGLDGLSLASIYFLAAIGLAITFGVMGVINMAHGEFIMMGAYTGYVVQQVIPNYTVSIIVALPLAFAVTFAAGVAMERLVIRWLYNRPLETLLATFGISVALQQLAKNIFGTQARPLTSPAWLDGALSFNDVISISYIRIAIFGLALVFLFLFLFIMKRTRLGLEVRAVTQNPRMAASMGINPDKINMLTFGLGSGIAGIAGVAIGLFAKVTSELGSDYIVQSFMTVVVGGVGNIWGTLAGATMIGGLQKGIEWMNPGNTLAAQTFMIIFIIIFIQFRPKGIIALKGRAAGD